MSGRAYSICVEEIPLVYTSQIFVHIVSITLNVTMDFDQQLLLGSFTVLLICHLLAHLLTHLFDKEDDKESDKLPE